MPTVTFIDPDGTSRDVGGEDGMTVMEIAVRNGIDGIEADCGGACACATCHVYVDPAWTEAVGPATDDESEMLAFAVAPESNSRLSCQIRLGAALDGLKVTVPYSQH